MISLILSLTSAENSGEVTLHKFGQGRLFEDIFGLPPKIAGFKFQPPKNNSILVPKANVILVLQLR